MKAIYFENLSEALMELRDNAIAELERSEYARDDAMQALADADEAGNWEACDKAESEYKRFESVVYGLETIVNNLSPVISAFEGLEFIAQDALKNMGLY